MAGSTISWQKKFCYSLAFLLFIFAGMILAISWYSMRTLLYPIDERVDGTPRSKITYRIRQKLISQYKAQLVSFKTEDGFKLAGMHVPCENPKGHLLLCHGYRHDKEGLHAIVKQFRDYSLFLFDFRGHGQSQQSMTTIGYNESFDVAAAMKKFKAIASEKSMREKPFYILGLSMGAAAALRALDQDPTLCDGIIADSSYAYLRDEIAHIFSYKSGLPNIPFLPVIRLFSRYATGITFDEVSPVDYIERALVPVFIIHSCADCITKPSDALALFRRGRRAKRRVKLWITPPYAHASLYKNEPLLYKKKVDKFLTQTSQPIHS